VIFITHRDIDERVKEIALYVAETGATVRTAAKRFGISKSTVHKDLASRLKYIDHELFVTVGAILEKNRAERHLRGGEATRQKFKK
jgi:putative DeoR family transcriptional regulator (stage III sporulation protein D)